MKKIQKIYVFTAATALFLNFSLANQDLAHENNEVKIEPRVHPIVWGVMGNFVYDVIKDAIKSEFFQPEPPKSEPKPERPIKPEPAEVHIHNHYHYHNDSDNSKKEREKQPKNETEVLIAR